MNKYTEVPEAKSLRWLAFIFPKIENPVDDCDRMTNCINLYCTSAADLIEHQSKEIDELHGMIDSLCGGVPESADKSSAAESRQQMNLEKAIELLKAEYKRVQALEYVKNPLAYAIYQVWKKADGPKTKGGE